MSEFLPNSFQTPNAYIDRFMHLLTAEEWKVLSYAARRIFGFGKRQDRISLSQFTGGVVDRKAGRRLDYGTGLSKSGVLHALAGLTQYGLLLEIEKGSITANTAALYELQLDSERVDLAGLEARAASRRTTNARRTGDARTRRAENLVCVTDEVPNLVSGTDEASSVGQTRAGLSDRQGLVCGTDTQKPVRKPVENQRDGRASDDAPPPPRKRTRTERKPRPRDLVFEALAEATGIDWNVCEEVDRHQLNQVAAKLRETQKKPDAEIAEDVRYTESYYRRTDWRGKQGERITLKLLRSLWGAAMRERRELQASTAPSELPPPPTERRLSPKEAAARVRELEAARTTGGPDAVPRAPL